MDAFKTHEQVIDSYRSYLSSFINIADEKIKIEVEKALHEGTFIPDPLIQFNPSFDKGKSLTDLINENKVHSDLAKIFGNYNLYKHQIEAIEIGIQSKGFIVTSGTGSGKSLTFLATLFNDFLVQNNTGKSKGVKAILVYPMNALINSQEEEIKKYEINYLKSFISKDAVDENGKDLDTILNEIKLLTPERFPISYTKYTGQEGADHKAKAEQVEPDIILTNCMMLELIMTRQTENWMRKSMTKSLKYLVFDELHTYRGRQGADVSMLIRRIKNLCKQDLICIGTSATMASVGNPLEKKEKIAEVGATIFGNVFGTNQIVGEHLITCTNGKVFSKQELENALSSKINIRDNEEIFIAHPLINWLELNIALKNNSGTLERGMPLSIIQIAEKIGTEVDIEKEILVNQITSALRWAEKLNEFNRTNKTNKSYLPFRFHQFISQTSNVSVTLEPREDRHIAITAGRYFVNENNEQKLLFPVLFSRYSGYDFICVEKNVGEGKLKPRNPNDSFPYMTIENAKGKTLSEANFNNGYIVIDDGEEFWADDLLDYAPPSWMNKNETAFTNFYNWHMPTRIYFNVEGDYGLEANPKYTMQGYYISARLKIDPTAGVIYETNSKDTTKLASLGNEGRSTATTIVSYAVINSLFLQNEEKANQKLLSFTDSRQDASLQAGHFNDFLSSIKLRNAIYKALQNNPNGLTVSNISDEVFKNLNVKEKDFARSFVEDAFFVDEDNAKALKDYILYRILQDLKRGWRYVLPNLEQTALLEIKYKNIVEISKRDDAFTNILFLNTADSEVRLDILFNVLNFFRTNLAIEHRYLLEEKSATESFLKDKLDSSKQWSLDKNEELDSPTYMIYTGSTKTTQRGLKLAKLGLLSGIGKYIKRTMSKHGVTKPNKVDFENMMQGICTVLHKSQLLYLKENIPVQGGFVNGYLLKTTLIEWHLGDGQRVAFDETRFNIYKDLDIKPNTFFQKLYKSNFDQYQKEILGKEHTGQLKSEDRQTREKDFRLGNISAMFCSPTMELGIDIANLNIVHMRNVPPNPANYAQRSGRAGRSGQTALVFTHCSNYSAHDQNYFKTPSTMVAGTVSPPRIDLMNEELLTAHFNAYILMELGISQVNQSIIDVVDTTDLNNIKVFDNIMDTVNNQILNFKDKWIASFKNTISFLKLDLDKTWWYTDLWYEQKVNSFADRFQQSFARWIKMFLSANKMILKARITMDNQLIKSDSPEKKDAKRQHAVGLKQKDLLINDAKKSSGNESEFYIFRYLASDGFLPGYNFTRLPIRVYLGAKSIGDGEYISRSRSMALTEFAPRNTIYHNGSKYQIERMNVLDAENLQQKIKISKDTGYAYMNNEAELANVDPITNIELKGDNCDWITTLVEMEEVEAPPKERISCVEEERSRQGYVTNAYFNYKNGIDATKQLVIKKAGHAMLNLIYDRATELINLNRQSKRSTSQGFDIDLRNGKWLTQTDLAKPEISVHSSKVVLFSRNNADTLYIQPLSNMGINAQQTITLSYALKRGIEKLFLIEENEIGVLVLGSEEKPNIMLYEASEGSLGILSQLIQEPQKLNELFKESYTAIHFDITTREETEEGKKAGNASYNDLLSYFNQTHHEKLNRYEIKEVLEQLMDCESESKTDGKDYEEQYKYLLITYDKSSGSELPLIKHLYKHKLALPDKAQVYLKEYYLSADFVYNTQNGAVIIFCDGAVHDTDSAKAKDTHDRQLLKDAGYDVIVWHYLEPVAQLIERRKDIFRKVN
jgi:superfamily II DNA/RNA helicase